MLRNDFIALYIKAKHYCCIVSSNEWSPSLSLFPRNMQEMQATLMMTLPSFLSNWLQLIPPLSNPSTKPTLVAFHTPMRHSFQSEVWARAGNRQNQSSLLLIFYSNNLSCFACSHCSELCIAVVRMYVCKYTDCVCVLAQLWWTT